MFSTNIVGTIDGYFVFFIFVIICYNKKNFLSIQRFTHCERFIYKKGGEKDDKAE